MRCFESAERLLTGQARPLASYRSLSCVQPVEARSPLPYLTLSLHAGRLAESADAASSDRTECAVREGVPRAEWNRCNAETGQCHGELVRSCVGTSKLPPMQLLKYGLFSVSKAPVRMALMDVARREASGAVFRSLVSISRKHRKNREIAKRASSRRRRSGRYT